MASHVFEAAPAVAKSFYQMMLSPVDAMAHDFRFYAFRLDGKEIATIAAEWPLKVCGNGIRQPDAGEECDDGNLDADDGCRCAREFRRPDPSVACPCATMPWRRRQAIDVHTP